MKYRLIYLLIFSIPILTIIIVNETSKPQQSHTISTPFFQNERAYHSDQYATSNCSWACHNFGCKHPHLIQNTLIEGLYFGIVNGNKSSNAYVASSVIFLALIWPLLILFLLFKNINLLLKRPKK